MLDLYWNITHNGPSSPTRWYVGHHSVVGIAENKAETPNRLILNIRPNPVKNQAVISYALPKSGSVSLKLYSADGRHLKTLDKGYCQAGNHTLCINTSGLPSGTYIIVLKTKNYQATKRLMVIN